MVGWLPAQIGRGTNVFIEIISLFVQCLCWIDRIIIINGIKNFVDIVVVVIVPCKWRLWLYTILHIQMDRAVGILLPYQVKTERMNKQTNKNGKKSKREKSLDGRRQVDCLLKDSCVSAGTESIVQETIEQYEAKT